MHVAADHHHGFHPHEEIGFVETHPKIALSQTTPYLTRTIQSGLFCFMWHAQIFFYKFASDSLYALLELYYLIAQVLNEVSFIFIYWTLMELFNVFIYTREYYGSLILPRECDIFIRVEISFLLYYIPLLFHWLNTTSIMPVRCYGQ
jgi:hypothetical protein